MNILLGIGLIAVGIWMAVVQGKNLIDGKPNSLGGISGLFMCGLASIAYGIIIIIKAVA